MQIPAFWAEARVVGQVDGKQRVLRRFGWSDADEVSAQLHAEQRASAAMAELQAGKQVIRRERKMPYGDAHGLPIREGIVSRQGDDVVTRNGYGARCLNQPDVLFADIDCKPRWTGAHFAILVSVPLALIVWAGVASLEGNAKVPCGILLTLGLVAALTVDALGRLRWSPWNLRRLRARDLRRVERLVRRSPGMRIALYETPAGFRLLALHRTFDPTGAEAISLLRRLDSDPVFVTMCKLQACFRARVSPKPWRMGMKEQIRPRPGVWPVNPARRADRDAWVKRYEALAQGYAACRFIRELGAGPLHPRADAVRRMHDEMARAHSGLLIA